MRKYIFKSAVTAILGYALALAVICGVVYLAVLYPQQRRNMACHRACVVAGYAAGEESPNMKHHICACFKAAPSSTSETRFVLKKSSKLE